MSCIEYRGEVTIVKKLKGKYLKTEHYHNNGTQWLFDYLCQYLWDGSVKDSGGVPLYLDIIRVTGSEGKKEPNSILTAPVYTYKAEGTRQTASSDRYPWIQRKFYVGYNNFLNTEDTTTGPLQLALMHAPGSDKYLATIPLVQDDGKTPLTSYDIKEGESHEIYWRMEFVNPAQEVANSNNSLSEGESN